MTALLRFLAAPLLDARHRPAWPIIVLFLLVQALVWTNCFKHDPFVFYDADAHVDSILVIAYQHHLPTARQSAQFFSAPLPYAVPALALQFTDDLQFALRLGMVAQAIASVLILWLMLRAARLVDQGLVLRVTALLLLGMMPAWYRTLVMIRGEVWVTLFGMLAFFPVLRLMSDDRPRWRDGVLAGLWLGLAALSRQWGLLLVPAVVLLGAIRLWKDAPARAAVLRAAGVAALVFSLACGWFYLHLQTRSGSALAFNRETKEPRPTAFYFSIAAQRVWERPLTPTLAGRYWPVLYADLWGDYWARFLVRARHKRYDSYLVFKPGSAEFRRVVGDRNDQEMSLYLSRVMLVSIAPSAILLIGFGIGAIAVGHLIRRQRREAEPIVLATCALVIVCGLAGYTWFVGRYSDETSDTVKASYLLHLLPPAALLGGCAIHRLWRRSAPAGWIAIIVLTGAGAHHFDALHSRYPTLPPPGPFLQRQAEVRAGLDVDRGPDAFDLTSPGPLGK